MGVRKLGVVLALTAVMLCAQGCVTTALWENEDWDHAGATTGRVVLTPFAVAVDALCGAIILYYLGNDEDDDC